MKKWPLETVDIKGASIEAQAPFIISASRATDMPAFYGERFKSWLKKGYCESINPFNGVKTPVTFSRCRLFVFWSKNPRPFIPVLENLHPEYSSIFNFTLNDYEAEGYEMHVTPLAERLQTMEALSRCLGPEKILWRYDPVLLSDSVTLREAARRIISVGDRLHHLVSRLVFSFVKIRRYKRVPQNIKNYDKSVRELTREEKEELVSIISRRNKEVWNLNLQSCGTPEDYTKYGVETSGCIGYHHVKSLGIDDDPFNEFYGFNQRTLFDAEVPKSILAQGQQEYCTCIQSKDIGRYNTCPHGCVYCYANRSPHSNIVDI